MEHHKKEEKKEFEKATTTNNLNTIFTERLDSKDKEEIVQKDGNKRLNWRDDAEKFQRVIRENQKGGSQVKLIDI